MFSSPVLSRTTFTQGAGWCDVVASSAPPIPRCSCCTRSDTGLVTCDPGRVSPGFVVLLVMLTGIWDARQAFLPTLQRPGPIQLLMLSLTNSVFCFGSNRQFFSFLLLFAALFTLWYAGLLNCLVWTSGEASSNCLSVDRTGSQRGCVPWSQWLDLPMFAIILWPFGFSFLFSLLSLVSVLMEYIQSCSYSLEV